MPDRDTTNSSTTPKPNGLDFLDEYSGQIKWLSDASVLPLSSVSGADTITATVDPPLPAGGDGLVAGMKFTIVWDQDNTGAATLNIGGRGAKNILAKDGGSILPGQLAAGAMDMLVYDGTGFVLLTDGASGGAAFRGRLPIFDVTGVFDAGNYPADTIIMVECWGAGGGGRSTASGGAGGGGGGAFQRAFLRCGDLSGSVTVSVPSGGATNADGGNCQFGSYVTAYGGAGSVGSAGGRGGSTHGGLAITGGQLFDGGGGGATSGAGLSACWGGGGGGGFGSAGGSSEFGGAGGASGVSGSRPGGGGGALAAGGPGRCIITVL